MRIYLHIWVRRSEMAALLHLAVEAGIERDYASELLRVLNLAGERPIDAANGIRLITLGSFDVLSRGKSVLTSAKLQRSPIALAVHLVAAGSSGMATETLGDRLWPEADEATARKRMKSTVYRLRQLLGSSDTVLTQGGRIAINPDIVTVDVWEVQALASAPTPGWAPEARYLEGMRLYAGPFVHHHADDTTLVAFGQKVELAIMDICTSFARSLILAGDWQRALRVAKEGLDRIGYHEQLFDIATEAAEFLGRQSELDALSEMLAQE